MSGLRPIPTVVERVIAFSAGPNVQPGDIDVTGQAFGVWAGYTIPAGWGVFEMWWKMDVPLMTNDGVSTQAATGLMGVAGDALQVNIPGTSAVGTNTAGTPQVFNVDADIGFDPTINGPSLAVSGRIRIGILTRFIPT